MNIPAPHPDSSPLSDRDVVTASDLVRHFGLWQERAARAPVYILHRGRPRHVLTSVEVMNALCAPLQQVEDAETGQSVDALLDLVDDIVVLAGADARIAAISLSARQFFGTDAQVGAMLERLSAPATIPLLLDAVHRVVTTGAAETIELAAARLPERRLGGAIVPYRDGIALKLHDLTLADETAAIRAQRHAEEQATAAARGIATARINLRGYLDAVSPSLCALTGLAQQSLASVRFVSLVEIGSRAALGDAIEAIVAGRESISLHAVLLVNRGNPVPVRIGISPIRHGAAIVGAVALIARNDALPDT